MRQLSGIDVSFLNMETDNVFGHVSSLNIYDPAGTPAGAGVKVMKAVILERLDRLRPFRQRLREVPFGLDLPYWVDDPNFDIDFHVRHHSVPAPGTPEQLAEVISRIHARPLDRSRPLWELYVIEGYDHGTRIAQLTKVHHATIDGVSGALMLAVILDLEPTVPIGPPAEVTAEPEPSDQELLVRTLHSFVRSPERALRLSLQTVRELRDSGRSGPGLSALADVIAQPIPGPLGDLLRRRLRSVASPDDAPPALPPTAAPKTPWNASIGRHRRFAFTSIPISSIKAVRQAAGCTFNDVVMAACSGMLRRYLVTHDCLPDDALIAFVPVSVRSGNEDDLYQNRVSALLADLATNEVDPARRLARVSASMSAAKDQLQAIPAATLTDFTQFAPPAIAARAMRMYSRLRIADRTAPPFNLVISNVPGPSMPLYAGGARLEKFYPVSTIVDGQGLNVTVQSYHGSLDVGLVADRDLVPDLWDMIPMFHDAVDELLGAVGAAPAPVTRSGAKRSAATRAAKKPAAAKRPAAKRPAAKRPAAKRPAAKRPAAKRPAAKRPAAKRPAAKRPAAKRPAAKRSAAKRPAS